MNDDEDNLPERHRLIDSSLKKVFQDKLDEDLPDRFKEMLQRLKDEQRPAKGDK